MLKKILAGGLAAALTLSLLTGCSAPAADSSSPDSYEAQIPAAAQEDVVSYLTGGDISCKDNVMTVNGIDVPAGAYFYWLADTITKQKSYYESSNDDSFSLDKPYKDGTYGDYIVQDTQNSLVKLVVTSQQAQKKGVKLTDEAMKMLNDMAEKADPKGFLFYSTDLEGQKFLYTHYNYSDALSASLFEKGGKYYPGKKVLADYRKENLLGAKHILVQTTGMSDQEKAKAKETIQGYLDKILASEDKASTFDQYMNEKSEDPGLAQKPDGYTFLPGDMVPEFEDAVTALKVGEITPELVESDYGYHIIMRVEPNPKDVDDETLKQSYQATTFTGLVDQWVKTAKVTVSDDLKNLDLNSFYNKLTSLQSTINAISKAEAEKQASASSNISPDDGEPAAAS